MDASLRASLGAVALDDCCLGVAVRALVFLVVVLLLAFEAVGSDCACFAVDFLVAVRLPVDSVSFDLVAIGVTCLILA